MSERKTSEIKLRVTPSFKAAVQLAAEQAGETMSVYIESASQDRILRDRTPAISMTGPHVEFRNDPFPHNVYTGSYGFPTSLNPNPPVAQNPVPAKDADGSCAKNCHPWEWCECKQLRRD